jgi:3-methyladenine DNA glycosylase AlkD
MTVAGLVRALQAQAREEKAAVLQRFFQTGPGEYAEGDRFLGVMVPQIRRLVPQGDDLPRKDIERLIRSPFHEVRLLGLLILVRRFARADDRERTAIYRLYLANTTWINNWDLVDLSAEHIVGAFLCRRSRAPLRRLIRSRLLWERRIALLATFHFIRRGEFGETLGLVEAVLRDREPLIHKAAGWMLREIGKRDPAREERFLARHLPALPRTTLRYAIERFPPARRAAYLSGATPTLDAPGRRKGYSATPRGRRP